MDGNVFQNSSQKGSMSSTDDRKQCFCIEFLLVYPRLYNIPCIFTSATFGAVVILLLSLFHLFLPLVVSKLFYNEYNIYIYTII